jgi:hypothetical protein
MMQNHEDKRHFCDATTPYGVKSRASQVAILVALLALLLSIRDVYAQAAQAQSVSAVAPATNSDINHQRPYRSADEDVFLNTLMNLPKVHKGEISFQDVDEPLIRKFECVNDTYNDSMGTSGDNKVIKDIYVKSHCSDGVRITYYGESKIRAENPTYELEIYWDQSHAPCIRADRVLELIKAGGWEFIAPPPASHYPLASSMDIANYFEYESKAMGGAILSVQWTSYEKPYSLMSSPPSQSCLHHMGIAARK